jgi:hypothetical protein
MPVTAKLVERLAEAYKRVPDDTSSRRLIDFQQSLRLPHSAK